jgi:ABC-2 type transport system ATP-binding protein
VTVFLTTHNLEEAQKLCSLVGVIREGKLIAMGNPDALRNSVGMPQLIITGHGFSDGVLAQLRVRPEVAAVERKDNRLVIDLKAESETAPLVSLVVTAGAEVEEVKNGTASLEEVFLTLMEEDQA